MKKMLVSGMLSSLLAVSAVWGESDIKKIARQDSNFPIETLLYIDYELGNYEKMPCDDPESKACEKEAKENCQGESRFDECVRVMKLSNNFNFNWRNNREILESFLKKQLDKKLYNEKYLSTFFAYAKEQNFPAKEILDFIITTNGKDENFITRISKNEAVYIVKLFKKYYGSMKNNKEVQNLLIKNKISKSISNELVE